MFSQNLKKLRKSKRMSQEDMANYLGISRQGYSKYENELSEPSYQMLMRIADLFNVSVDDLLGYEPPLRQEKESVTQSIFPYDQLGINQEEFENLTAYQQEVLEWAINEDAIFFKNKSDNVMDMLERLEVAYEVDKVMKKREKKK